MAAEVLPLALYKAAPPPSSQTPEQKYWETFSTQALLPTPNSSPVTHIASNPAPVSLVAAAIPHSHYIAVTTGARLQILSPQNLKTIRTITRTSSAFHGAAVRRDGRIVLAGSDTGSIQAFDTSSRAILRTWTGEHKQPVWVTQWHPTDLTGAMSCCDDGTVRLWDLPSEASVWSGWGHEDYVRCGGFVGGNANLLVSGSYDRSIRLWDPRVGSGRSGSKASVMHFKMAAPVEAVMSLAGGTTLIAAAAEKVAVLDLVGGKPLHLLQNHQKTVTSLAVGRQGSRVLSGALDGHVKVFDTTEWKVVAGFKYPSPVLAIDLVSVGLSREDRHLCVGMESGLLSIRTRLSGAAKVVKREREKEMQALVDGRIDQFDKKRSRKQREKRLRSKNYTGEGADIIIDGNDRGKIRKFMKWEDALRKGEYQRSLDLALEMRDKQHILSLLTALVHRSHLRTAIKGRKANTLMPLLRWLNKNIIDPRWAKLTKETAMHVLDLYGENLGQSPEVDTAFWRLRANVRMAVETSFTCSNILGMLDLLETGAVAKEA